MDMETYVDERAKAKYEKEQKLIPLIIAAITIMSVLVVVITTQVMSFKVPNGNYPAKDVTTAIHGIFLLGLLIGSWIIIVVDFLDSWFTGYCTLTKEQKIELKRWYIRKIMRIKK